MNSVMRKVLLFITVVVLSMAYIGCASSSKKDSSTEHQHSESEGHCH